ncbi:MAG: acyltransferase [Planctomycetes bacterium]|nr:acyltransferase [Planctomycetota bacterium]
MTSMPPESARQPQTAEQTPRSERTWQAHLDGLRALAIVPVVLYHLFPKLCPGGFAGVDVFFVISGYLITGSIVAELDARQFSLVHFYVRRAKRILPAYYALVAFVLLAAVWSFPVTRAQSVSTTALYSLAYATNIYFWKVINYFDLSAQENPLLHLWSLGVEEQFYFVVPLILWALCQLRRRWLLPSLVLLSGVSFCCSQWAVSNGHSPFAFYMLPSRSWELLAGAILSQLPAVSRRERPRAAFLAWFGGALVMLSYLMLRPETPFPGLTALPTVVGTGLLIRYGAFGLPQRVLSYRGCVWIGKVSYSLYLWHWPLFVLLVPYYSLSRIVICFLATCIASWLSWYFIENPVRRAKNFGVQHAWGTVIGATVLLAGVCLTVNSLPVRNGTVPLAWHEQQTWATLEMQHDPRRSTCDLVDLQQGDPRLLLPIGRPNQPAEFVLWGDSHALALLPGVDALADEYSRSGWFINLKHNFTLKSEIGTEAYDPRGDREPVLRWLEETPQIHDVFLVSSWFFQLRDSADADETIRLCQRLKTAGKRVYVFSTVPLANKQALQRYDWGQSVSDRINRTDAARYTQSARRQNTLLERIVELGVAEVVPLDRGVREGEAYVTGAAGRSFYYDESHLNEIGAKQAMKIVAPTIWGGSASDRLDAGRGQHSVLEQLQPGSDSLN